MTTYICGISDGLNWNAGGQTTITARNVAQARSAAESWAEAGDYPCDGPVTVTLVLRAGESETRWSHEIPAEICRD